MPYHKEKKIIFYSYGLPIGLCTIIRIEVGIFRRVLRSFKYVVKFIDFILKKIIQSDKYIFKVLRNLLPSFCALLLFFPHFCVYLPLFHLNNINSIRNVSIFLNFSSLNFYSAHVFCFLYLLLFHLSFFFMTTFKIYYLVPKSLILSGCFLNFSLPIYYCHFCTLLEIIYRSFFYIPITQVTILTMTISCCIPSLNYPFLIAAGEVMWLLSSDLHRA